MEGDIIPGTSVGPWKLDSPKSEVLEILNSLSVQHTQASPGGFDFVNTNALSFFFDRNGKLNQICVIGEDAEVAFRGVSLGSRVDELGKLGYVVSMDLADRLLVIRDTPGIFFNFAGDEIDYEEAEEVCFEGDEDQLREVIRPNDILQSAIDRICITSDPDINPMFDLNV